MKLTDIGLSEEIVEFLKKEDFSEFEIGRVTQEHRERYVVTTGEDEYDAEITGNMRFTASSRADFPAVGDWVAMKVYDSNLAIIHKILPRKSVLERQAVGKPADIQIISANIDVAFIIQAINNNFNINRLERYLTICYSSNIEPVFVLSKIDLITTEEISRVVKEIEARDKKVRYILLSNITKEGLGEIMSIIQKGMTYCVIGSSGVGKSTLINNLLDKEIQRTGQISHSTNKGRHVTEHRELFVLENGGILIDTPGMKELGLTDSSDGLKTTFQDIDVLASKCRFPDCRHIDEAGCAVLDAVSRGTIDPDSLSNYQKLLKEQERFTISVAEKRRKEKIFGRMMKNYKKGQK